MSEDELKAILAAHKAWLEGTGDEGKRANLRGADLRGANLCVADLRDADLFDADLRDADLRGASLDFTSWPLWCGSLGVKIDTRIAAQLMYHTMRAIASCAGENREIDAVLASEECVVLANRFHRADECGIIERLAAKAEGGAK